MSRLLRLASSICLASIGLVLPRSALAQWPQPRLTGITRPGCQAGESAEVTLNGTDLEGVHTLWFDHPGLRAFRIKGTTFRVDCASSVPVGQHDVRAFGPYGVSNPRTFYVGDRPETLEVEPNNQRDQATPLAMNSAVHAQMTATDVDFFVFEGKKDQRVRLEIMGRRLETRLDAMLRIQDAAGRDLAESREGQGVDPLIDLTLPADGKYFAKVHDITYEGSPDHSYRLSLSDAPHLDAILPTVAKPGVPTPFTLLGRGLGGTLEPDLKVDGQPIERLDVTLTPPSGEIDTLLPSFGFLPSTAGPRRGFEYRLSLPTGTSNPVFIAVATDPVVLEVEPNDQEAQAQVITPPCDISGQFQSPGDLDTYQFQAKKGEVWWIDVAAERLGSPADPTFVVRQVVANAPPKELGVAEDTADVGGGARFGLGTVDASLRWQAPEDGTYQVLVNDLYLSQRGDARLTYRLNIRPERPDFRLFILPASPTLVDSLTIPAGGHGTATVLAYRMDGFNGPIRVESVELPPGVSCEPAFIAAGQTTTSLVFHASADAKPQVGTIRVQGRSRFDGHKVGTSGTVGGSSSGPDLTRVALAGNMIQPPSTPAAPAMALARVTRGFVAAVVEARPLELSASPTTVQATQGRQVNLDLNLVKRLEFADAVTVTGADLPANVANATANIAKDDSKGTLSLFIPKTVPPGEFTFHLRGSGPYPYSKDPNAKTKPKITLNEPSNLVTLVVRPAPVALTLNLNGGAIKQGAELTVDVTIARQNGFTGALTLDLVAPPALKLSADQAQVAEGQGMAKVVVRAAADTPPGAAAAVYLKATASVDGESVHVDEPMALTVNN